MKLQLSSQKRLIISIIFFSLGVVFGSVYLETDIRVSPRGFDITVTPR